VNQIVNRLCSHHSRDCAPLRAGNGVAARYLGKSGGRFLREFLSRQEDTSRLTSDVDWLAELPVKNSRSADTSPSATAGRTLREVCRFLRRASGDWEAVWAQATAYRIFRRSPATREPSPLGLRIGELQAVGVEHEPFDKAALNDAIPDSEPSRRYMTLEQWWPALVARCSAVVSCRGAKRERSRARINGAARWLAPTKRWCSVSFASRGRQSCEIDRSPEVGQAQLHQRFVGGEPASGSV